MTQLLSQFPRMCPESPHPRWVCVYLSVIPPPRQLSRILLTHREGLKAIPQGIILCLQLCFSTPEGRQRSSFPELASRVPTPC